MTRNILCALCVAAAAASWAGTATPAKSASASIAGRWQGTNYIMSARAPDCDNGKCTLTLDIVQCGTGWCGIEVASDNTCGATALKFNLEDTGTGATVFKGSLELARGAEPYIVQAYLVPAPDGGKEWLEIQGDTGGEFRMYRRMFPFTAHLARTGEAICKTEKPVS